MSSDFDKRLKAIEEETGRLQFLADQFAQKMGNAQKKEKQNEGATDESGSFRLDCGKRLKQERERLGLSQAEFAQKAGIHRNTQVRYEGGSREPDSDYILKIQDVGVDAGFLFFGRRTDATSVYSLAAARLLPKVAERAGLSGRALLALLDLVAEDESASWTGSVSGYSSLNPDDLVSALFENGALLADVFDGVSLAQLYQDIALTYGKRAQVVMMLYRSFRSSGAIDVATIEEAVKLAGN